MGILAEVLTQRFDYHLSRVHPDKIFDDAFDVQEHDAMLSFAYCKCPSCQNVEPSTLYAVAALSDGYVVVAGTEDSDSGDEDFVSFKLDPSDGTLIWKWKVR